MKNQLKQTRTSFVLVFATSLLLALAVRLGLSVLDGKGGVTYYNVAATSGTIIDQLLSVVTCAQLLGFMSAMGIACAGYACGNVVLAKNSKNEKTALGTSFVWGLLSTIIAALVAVIVVSKVFSPVQVSAMEIKLKVEGSLALIGICGVLALTSAFMSASSALSFALAGEKVNVVKALVVALVWGVVTAFLTVFTVNALNVEVLNAAASCKWFLIDIAINVVLAVVFDKVSK